MAFYDAAMKFVAAFAVLAVVLAGCVPRVADTGTPAVPPSGDAKYLDFLKDDTYLLSKFTSQQLLAEGYKVCNLIHSGAGNQDSANDVVQRDFSVSDSAAGSVVAAAVVGLGC